MAARRSPTARRAWAGGAAVRAAVLCALGVVAALLLSRAGARPRGGCGRALSLWPGGERESEEESREKVLQARKEIADAQAESRKRVLRAEEAVRQERRRKIAQMSAAEAALEKAELAVDAAKERRDELTRQARRRLRHVGDGRGRAREAKAKLKDTWEAGQLEIVRARQALEEQRLEAFKMKADARAALQREKIALADIRKAEEERLLVDLKDTRETLRKALKNLKGPWFGFGRRRRSVALQDP